MVRMTIPAISALAFTTTGCMGVDKLDGTKGWSPTDLGPSPFEEDEGNGQSSDPSTDGEADEDPWEDDEGEIEVSPDYAYSYPLVGNWTGVEFNGMELPYSYEGGTFGIYLSIESDYTGEMLLTQAYGDYNFEVVASGSQPEYRIEAPEMGASLDCMMTDMDILDCSYSIGGSAESYSMVFSRD
jgi:hypothetical protein